LGLSAAAVGSALIGTGPRAFAATGTPRQGGTLTVVISAEPPALTAIATTAFNTVLVSAKVTECLLIPGLGEVDSGGCHDVWVLIQGGKRSGVCHADPASHRL
jgi:hypothetical protein